MLALQCRACGRPLNSQDYIDHLGDYEDLCPVCLESIGVINQETESQMYLREYEEWLKTLDHKEDVL